jgi:phospholipase/carboxylesterase
MATVTSIAPDVPRCVLERVVEQSETAAARTMIGLHGEDSTHGDMLPLLREIGGGWRLVAPRSARWAAFGGGGRYSWYSNVRVPAIEPVGFGDALIQLETLLLDEAQADGGASPLVLVGAGQGGTMALALAAIWPDLVDGVIVIAAGWPQVAGWDPPPSDMSRVAVLLVGASGDAAARLRSRGARPSEINCGTDQKAIAMSCRRWLDAKPFPKPERIS